MDCSHGRNHRGLLGHRRSLVRKWLQARNRLTRNSSDPPNVLRRRPTSVSLSPPHPLSPSPALPISHSPLLPHRATKEWRSIWSTIEASRSAVIACPTAKQEALRTPRFCDCTVFPRLLTCFANRFRRLPIVIKLWHPSFGASATPPRHHVTSSLQKPNKKNRGGSRADPTATLAAANSS